MSSAIWIGPDAFASGEPSLTLEAENTSHTYTKVTASSTGDAWVTMPLPLPALARATKIHLQYAVGSASNYISQVRLCDTTDAVTQAIVFDDATTLQSTTPATYDSADFDIDFSFAAELKLKLTFGNTTDQVKLGAVGLEFDLGREVDAREYATVADADAAAAAAGYTLLFPPGSYPVAGDLTLASRCRFDGGLLVPGSGVTVTIAGAVECPFTTQCFDVSAGGAVVFDAAAGVPAYEISAAWFGCLKDADFTAPLQAAINSVPAETHSGNPQLRVRIHVPFEGSIKNTITVDRRGVTLVGSGTLGSVPSPAGEIATRITWAGTTSDVPMLEFLEAKYCGLEDIQLIGNATYRPHGIYIRSDDTHGVADFLHFTRVQIGPFYDSTGTVDINKGVYAEAGASGGSGYQVIFRDCRINLCSIGISNPNRQELNWRIEDGAIMRCGVAIQTASRMRTENCYHVYNGCEFEFVSDPAYQSAAVASVQARRTHIEHMTQLCRSLTADGNGVWFWLDIEGGTLQIDDIADNPLRFVDTDGDYDQRITIRRAKITDLRAGGHETNPTEVRMLLPTDSTHSIEKVWSFEGWCYSHASVSRCYTEDNWQFVYRPSGSQNGGKSVFRVRWERHAGPGSSTEEKREVEAVVTRSDVGADLDPLALTSLTTCRHLRGEKLALGNKIEGTQGVAHVCCVSTTFPLSGASPYSIPALPQGAVVLGVALRKSLTCPTFTGDLGVAGDTTRWAGAHTFGSGGSTGEQFAPGDYKPYATGGSVGNVVLTTTTNLDAQSVEVTVLFIELLGAQ